MSPRNRLSFGKWSNGVEMKSFRYKRSIAAWWVRSTMDLIVEDVKPIVDERVSGLMYPGTWMMRARAWGSVSVELL